MPLEFATQEQAILQQKNHWGWTWMETHQMGTTVIGMLQYLQGHSRPNITMAVSHCARYVHKPKCLHKEALEQIGQYLKKTENKGLIYRPSDVFKIDCYVYANFAGLWGYKNPLEPSVAKS
jgi:hypothetical protein